VRNCGSPSLKAPCSEQKSRPIATTKRSSASASSEATTLYG
jgi:hypothetical protein